MVALLSVLLQSSSRTEHNDLALSMPQKVQELYEQWLGYNRTYYQVREHMQKIKRERERQQKRYE